MTLVNLDPNLSEFATLPAPECAAECAAESAPALVTASGTQGVPECAAAPRLPRTGEALVTPAAPRKRRLYERSGVGEYWVVDPDLEVVRVYRNEDGRFERPVELRADAGDVLTSPTLAGLEMPLGRIFAD